MGLHRVREKHGHPHAKVTQAHVRAMLNKSAVAELEKHAVQTWALGCWWDPYRKWKAGLIDDPKCPFCPHPECTVEHLVMDCPAFDHFRGRDFPLIHATRVTLILNACFLTVQLSIQVVSGQVLVQSVGSGWGGGAGSRSF